MPRLFVAVTPPDDARIHLARALSPLRGSPGEPRWVPTARWHLTLLYLGTVAEERTAGLRTALAAVVEGSPAMNLRISGAGRFGAGRRPQVFWAGLAGDVPGLTRLADGLRDEAARLGHPVDDRPFRAHLTVGRWRPGRPADATLPDRLAGYGGPDWPVTEVALLASHLGPDPHYETIDTWGLTRRTP
jgi:2'-5' RNA ligase